MPGPNINYDDIIRQLEQAQQQANAANLERYGQLLGTIDSLGQQVGAMGTYGQAQSSIEQVGNAARERIEQGRVRQGALADQDLTTRGLGNTTIRTSAMRGVNEDAARLQGEVDEQQASLRGGLLERRAGMEAQIGGMKANAIEGRFDNGPDLGLYANLLQASSAAGNQQPVSAFVPNQPGNYGAMGGGGAIGGGGGGGGGGLAPGLIRGSGGGGGGGGGYERIIRGGVVQSPNQDSSTVSQTAPTGLASYGGASTIQGSGAFGASNISPGTGFNIFYGNGQVGGVGAGNPGMAGYGQISGPGGSLASAGPGSPITSSTGESYSTLPATQQPLPQGAQQGSGQTGGASVPAASAAPQGRPLPAHAAYDIQQKIAAGYPENEVKQYYRSQGYAI